MQYFHMNGAEVKSTVDADSVIARELVERMQKDGQTNGIVKFPDVGKNFDHGVLVPAKGAHAFSIDWVRIKINV